MKLPIVIGPKMDVRVDASAPRQDRQGKSAGGFDALLSNLRAEASPSGGSDADGAIPAANTGTPSVVAHRDGKLASKRVEATRGDAVSAPITAPPITEFATEAGAIPSTSKLIQEVSTGAGATSSETLLRQASIIAGPDQSQIRSATAILANIGIPIVLANTDGAQELGLSGNGVTTDHAIVREDRRASEHDTSTNTTPLTPARENATPTTDAAMPASIFDMMRGLLGMGQSGFTAPAGSQANADLARAATNDPNSSKSTSYPALSAGLDPGSIQRPLPRSQTLADPAGSGVGPATAILTDVDVSTTLAPAGGLAHRPARGGQPPVTRSEADEAAHGPAAVAVGGEQTHATSMAGIAATGDATPGDGRGPAPDGPKTSPTVAHARVTAERIKDPAVPGRSEALSTELLQSPAKAAVEPLRAIIETALAPATLTGAPTIAALAHARTMTLQVSAGELGTIGVRLHRAGQALDVELSVADKQAEGLIGRERDALTGALRDHGFEVRSLVIQGSDAPPMRENNAPANTRDGGGSPSGSGRKDPDSTRDDSRRGPPAPDRAMDPRGHDVSGGARPDSLFV